MTRLQRMHAVHAAKRNRFSAFPFGTPDRPITLNRANVLDFIIAMRYVLQGVRYAQP